MIQFLLIASKIREIFCSGLERMFQMHHVTEYPPIKTGDIRGYNLSDIPQFSNPMSTRENCVYKT